jgi:hypothetical protein
VSRLYHTTLADRADSIMREGFRDHRSVRPTFAGCLKYPPGVWLGNIPALDDELFDALGLFDLDAERQDFIAVDVPPFPYVFARNEVLSIDDDAIWPGCQWWGPAAVWNCFPRAHLSLDEAIDARLAMICSGMDPRQGVTIGDQCKWTAERLERDCNCKFAARLARHLGMVPSHERPS